jgi:hypothetical protein
MTIYIQLVPLQNYMELNDGHQIKTYYDVKKVKKKIESS